MKFSRVKLSEQGTSFASHLYNMVSGLAKIGFVTDVKGAGFSQFSINPEIRGYNVSAKNQKRSRVLSWADWVEVNAFINEYCNKHGISAKVSTLGGKFVIREGMEALTESDWDDFKYENVGSLYNPIPRHLLYTKA